MKLTREEALKYHRQMWTDMQKELGNKPDGDQRVLFKVEWCAEHFPDEKIDSNCFLCEYLAQNDYNGYKGSCHGGRECLLIWPYGNCTTHGYYYDAPISKILALPKRKIEQKWNKLDRDTFNCTKCGATFILIQGSEKMHFCPNCGEEKGD